MYENIVDYTTLIGSKFDQFLLKDIIGEGAMGVVYKARDTQLNRDVALKILKKEALHNDSDLLKRFKREAQNIAKLQYEHIIDVYSVGMANDFNYIVMEYVDGYKLSDLLKSKESLEYQFCINIMYLICRAIEYSHSKGILHRDIKPENIMISTLGDIKIVDFGLSKVNNIDMSKISHHGDLIGTPIYMSLEVMENSDNFTEKSDIYSLGVLFYQILTGEYPFNGKSTHDLYKHLILGKYKDAKDINNNIPMEINNLINNMLKKDPNLRYDLKTIINILSKYINFDLNGNVLNSHVLKKAKIDVSNYPTKIVNKQNVSQYLYKNYIKQEMFLWLLLILSSGIFTLFFILFFS